jgi:hypothetical protein
MTVRVRIESDEWWPVHSVSEDDSYGEWVEVPEDTVERWRNYERGFREMQQEMREALEAAGRTVAP